MNPQRSPIVALIFANASCSLISAQPRSGEWIPLRARQHKRPVSFDLFIENEGKSGLRGREEQRTGSKSKEHLTKKKQQKQHKQEGQDRQTPHEKPSKSSSRHYLPHQAQAGHNYQSRIIGGSQAWENEYPFAVSLQDHIGHFCGGSLIARNVVLSAAHCQGSPYGVVLGRNNLGSRHGQEIDMQHELPHPKYNNRTTDNDFMLVFLKSPATLNDGVGLVPLNNDPSTPNVRSELTVMGWGDIDIRDDVSKLSDVLVEVQVSVISNQECDKSSGEIGGYSDNYHGQITKNMLCANANRQDSCQGDSGGPLVRGNTQVGVVSRGIGCASRHFPGVYARVSRVYDWIQSEVCKRSEYAEEAGFDCSNDSYNPFANAPSPSPPSASVGGWPPSGGSGGGWFPSGIGGSSNSDNDYDDDWEKDDDDYTPAPSPSVGGVGSSPSSGTKFNSGDDYDDDWGYDGDDYSYYGPAPSPGSGGGSSQGGGEGFNWSPNGGGSYTDLNDDLGSDDDWDSDDGWSGFLSSLFGGGGSSDGDGGAGNNKPPKPIPNKPMKPSGSYFFDDDGSTYNSNGSYNGGGKYNAWDDDLGDSSTSSRYDDDNDGGDNWHNINYGSNSNYGWGDDWIGWDDDWSRR